MTGGFLLGALYSERLPAMFANTRPFRIILLLLGLCALLAGVVAAQSDTPAAALLCDPAALRDQQAQYAALLADFDAASQSDPAAALQTLFEVGAAYQTLALDCGYIPPDAAIRAVGTDVTRILNTLDTLYGDPLNGQVLYTGELACASCHEVGGGTVAPHTEGTFTRIEETRLSDPLLADYTPEQYIVESIVNPTHYVVPNYQPVMPTDFGERLTAQDLADILAFLLSQDGPSPE